MKKSAKKNLVGIGIASVALVAVVAILFGQSSLFQGWASRVQYGGSLQRVPVQRTPEITTGQENLVQIMPCLEPYAGLMHWWDGDQISASSTRDLQGDRDATLLHGVSTKPGKVGNALSFDGSDDEMKVFMGAVWDTITVDAWVYHDGDFTLNHNPVIAAQDGDISWILQVAPIDIGANNNIIFEYDDGVTHKRVLAGCRAGVGTGCSSFPTGVPFIQPDEWYHIAVALNTSTGYLKVYINGVDVPITAETSLTPVSGSMLPALLVGNRYGLNPNTHGLVPWKGLIDEIDLFNRVLTPTEIQSIVSSQFVGKCKPEPEEDLSKTKLTPVRRVYSPK